jgi:hypothetical protein
VAGFGGFVSATGFHFGTVTLRLLGFAGTLLLPIDVAQSRPGEPSSPVMETFWMFVYWSTFLLTWIIVPLLQVWEDTPASVSFPL